MPTLIIRNVPETVCQKIKKRAKDHRRSMSMEALTMLEQELNFFEVPALDISKRPPRMKFLKPIDLSPEAINAMIDEGQK